MKVILAALRTSEFWAFLAMVALETFNAPIPDEFKIVAPVYIALRIVGKVAQFVFPNPANPTGSWMKKDNVAILALAGALSLASPVTAQPAERFHVTANGGAMYFTQGEDWSGASLGAGIGYNLHEKFSVFGGYDHGFPINDVDEQLDLWRAVGSVQVHEDVFLGFGYATFGKDIEGGLAQLTVSKQVAHRLAVGGLYAHVFARDELDDFEYARVFLAYHLLGRE